MMCFTELSEYKGFNLIEVIFFNKNIAQIYLFQANNHILNKMMYKIRGDMMKMIGKNSLRVLSAAMLIGTVTLGVPGIAKEVYPGVNVPDEVYKTEYGDKENYSEIKYYKWQTNEAGIKVLGEGTKEDNDLKYYVSSRKENVSDISGVISGNQDASDPVTISEKGDYNGIWVDNSEAQVLGEQTPFFLVNILVVQP